MIANELNTSKLVFIDARVPETDGESALVPEEFLGDLTALAEDGVLPRWSEWFPPGTMETLVPDPVRRDAVVAELPRLPLSYLRGRVPVPDGWATAPCAYVLTSEGYRREAEEAASRGWSVIEVLGSHLELVAQPLKVAEALRNLVV